MNELSLDPESGLPWPFEDGLLAHKLLVGTWIHGQSNIGDELQFNDSTYNEVLALLDN